MRAAIYCRVSTEDQEREGTSLDSQLEACLKKADELGYEVPEDFIILETYSGLTLDRPKLPRLRQWMRDKEVDAVIGYTLDRLSRDPVHFIILQEELERAGAELILVTETVDSSDLGRLITYIKGYAAKLEAEKIRERTMRGKRTRALAGKLPANSHANLYGYNYMPGKGIGEGIRYVNENEAKWVREIYRWLVEEGLSVNAITYRLRSLGIPTPSGNGYWIKSTVHKILTNLAYTGKTYAFTQTYGEPKYRLKANPKRRKSGVLWKPKEEWIEIPNATPPIISQELFEAAQRQLKRNRELSLGNTRHQYLLHGHIYCPKCGRSYWGKTSGWHREDKHYERRYYRCSGNAKIVSPEPCGNRNVNAGETERVVWEQIEALLTRPELVLAELKTRKEEVDKTTFLERDLGTIKNQLTNRQRQKDRIHKAFYLTGDEEAFKRNIGMLAKEIEALKETQSELEERISASKQFEVDIDGVKGACELVKRNLKTLSFEEKRLALEALQVKVWVSDDGVEINGCIPIPLLEIESMPY